METAIIYSRVSTAEQANEKQVEYLKEYCRTNGYEINGVYEETISGAATVKEKLDLIMNSEPMADLLVIREISRLSREDNIIDAAKKVDTLKSKYTIIIAGDNYRIPKGECMSLEEIIVLVVRLCGAADERKKIRMRTNEARRRYRENPLNNAVGKAPFGLKKIDNPNYVKGSNTKKIFAPDTDGKWNTVLYIYTLKAEGNSYREISKKVGLSQTFVVSILKNKRIRFFLPSGLAEAADEMSKRNDCSPNPHKFHNPYKNIIFDGYSEKAMIHQTTSIGIRYFVDGKGSINENDLNETVLKALQSFVKVFHIAKDDVQAQLEHSINDYKLSIATNKTVIKDKQKELMNLRKKAMKTTDITLYEMIQEEISEKSKEIYALTEQIEGWEAKINELKNVEIEEAVVTKENLETYVHRYVKAVRYFPVSYQCRRIRVEIKDEYIPVGYANFKEYEVMNRPNRKYIKVLPYSPKDLTQDYEDSWVFVPSIENEEPDFETENVQEIDFQQIND